LHSLLMGAALAWLMPPVAIFHPDFDAVDALKNANTAFAAR